MLARIFLRLLALLVALIQHFDLLELLECLTEGGLGIVKLHAQFVGRVLEIFAARRRRLRIGRIGKMSGIVDTRTVLLDLDLALEIAGNTVELGDHRLDLSDLAPLLVDLKFFKTDKGFA